MMIYFAFSNWLLNSEAWYQMVHTVFQTKEKYLLEKCDHNVEQFLGFVFGIFYLEFKLLINTHNSHTYRLLYHPGNSFCNDILEVVKYLSALKDLSASFLHGFCLFQQRSVHTLSHYI